MNYRLLSLLLGWMLYSPSLLAQPTCSNCKPRLIIQIIIDQFRNDYLSHYQDNWQSRGFAYLTQNGVWYKNAHHPHANTTTVVGHTTIATGTPPLYHGMVANEWFDRKKNQYHYCLYDPQAPILPPYASSKNTTVSITEGRSPKNIIASTLSDELALASGGLANVFAVSTKDRGAITLAGHAGKAFWFDTKTGAFISSKYYYSDYPQWVNQFNQQRKADALEHKSWRLAYPEENYRNPSYDLFNPNYQSFGKSFPHPFGDKTNDRYYQYFAMSPFGDALSLDFAKHVIISNKLGSRDSVSDYLGISLSSTDKIGHNFGPNSLESEDNLRRLDKELEQFFKFIDAHIGLDKTLIILSSDHGVSDAPEYLKSLHVDSGRIRLERLIKTQYNPKLKTLFNVKQNLIKAYSGPYFYLNHEAIKQQHLDSKKVSAAVIALLEETPGVFDAYSSKEILNNKKSPSYVTDSIRKSIFAKRSGDIFIVPKPYWFAVTDSYGETVTHGSPWRYDTNVPIIFAGFGLNAKVINRPISTIDIAPSLASLLNIRPPSSTTGKVLPEIGR